ncbi:hypothetical protein A7E78_09465 [Syntrophotalea acetylenivorans]|uniref:Putative heavy-metal chelation domain-containing protein n=1 Tax=Syntrophotalea acetylenivorans TaxID=1842532 RepID=A0A1L3GQ67_9BACT|nr:DUF364 domain-containing protein [Syntrophotalea acetylenivorans]APG28043.1 hypothetical protein A7E78_09465 [Syntrophotalea acetylenivorans]
MDVLKQALDKLTSVCAVHDVDLSLPVTVRCLTPDEAIGAEASSEFVIKKGKERVIEAHFDGAGGQAFTDHPSDWQGSLDELMQLDLTDTGQRAIVTAGLNAVLRRLDRVTGTIHCRNDEPSRCGEEFTNQLYERFGIVDYGLIGLQPAILEAMGDGFGTARLRVLDLNEDNIGEKRFGVTVWDGEKDLKRLVDWCEIGVATGSSVVNGSINDLLKQFQAAGKPLIFFGNTISGVAALLDLPRLCPYGR